VNCGAAGMMNDEIRMMNDAERESASFLTVPSGQALITHNSSLTILSGHALITHNFSMFPNPATGMVVITLSNQHINNQSNQQTSTSDQQLVIRDALGRLVWLKQVSEETTQVVIDLEEAKFMDGVYQVSLYSLNGVVTKSLVVSKQ
jgi:Secretion system C-terminal sorting domain